MEIGFITPPTSVLSAIIPVYPTNGISRVSCQKGPTHHAYAWQIGPFWQDILDMSDGAS